MGERLDLYQRRWHNLGLKFHQNLQLNLFYAYLIGSATGNVYCILYCCVPIKTRTIESTATKEDNNDSLQSKIVLATKGFKTSFWISIKVIKQIVRKNLKRAFFPFNSIKTFRAKEYKISVFIGITQHKEVMLHEHTLVRFPLTIRLWQPACDLRRSR